MSTQAHTPGPWRIFTNRDGTKLVGIGAEDGGGICDAGFGIWSWKDAEGIAKAELIVRAVNSHVEMLATLTQLREAVMCQLFPFGECTMKSREYIWGCVQDAAAVIAKAEGR